VVTTSIRAATPTNFIARPSFIVFLENTYLCYMIKTKEDIRNIHLDSILLILIFYFGLAISQNTDYNKSTPNCKPVPVEISIHPSNATLSSGIQLHYLQKSWIPNSDNFRLLTFVQTQFLDNKKVNQKIYLLDKIRKRIPGFLILLIQYHLFPQENSELPVLS
jgi:hypothetical protein